MDNRRLLIILIVELVLVFTALVIIRGCVGAKKDKSGGVCSSENEVRELECPAGESGRIFQICKNNNWQESFNDCRPSNCSNVVFDSDIKPILDEKCASCHPGFNEYETAKAKIDQYIARINKPEGDPQRMPQNKDPLPQNEKDLFQAWKDGGLEKACEDTGNNNNPLLDLDYIESAILQDLNNLSSGDQLEARYVLTSHKSNEKANSALLTEFRNGINKGLNVLSRGRNIINAVPIDQYQTVFRVLLRDLKLNAADWKLIEDADPVNLESFTNIGVLLKGLTGARKPWLHVDSFNFTAHQPATYYAIRKLPATANQLFLDLGVDFNGDQANFAATFVGLTNSRVALNKNRLMTFFDSNDGTLSVTFDIIANSGDPKRNLLENPLLKSASGDRNFKFDAAEFIFSLPNGLYGGFFLSDAAGKRQNVVPLNVAADYLNNDISPEIVAGLSCNNCHSQGFLAADDKVLRHVQENAANFDLADVDLVEALYRPYDFTRANAEHVAALAKMGIGAADRDPINLTSNNLRRNHNALAVASLLFLSEEAFIDGLQRSAVGRQQAGALLVGGEISSETLIQVLPVLLVDLRIGQNPI